MDIFITYFKVFLTGGILCTIAQVLIDKTQITPAKILVIFVCMGAILTGLGIYKHFIDFGATGASVPISGFGYSLATGVMEEVDKIGIFGIFTGGVKATASGITAAIIFGYLFALISKPDIKK